MVLNEHLLLFSCSAVLRELHYVLILRSFQEKYIPQRCFNVCDIMEEKVSPSWQAASSPNQTTRPCALSHEGKYACAHIAQKEYSCTIWPVQFEEVPTAWVDWNYTSFTETIKDRV